MIALALTISLTLDLLVAPRSAQALAKVPRIGMLTAGPEAHPILLPSLGRYCPWYNPSLYSPHQRRV